MRIDNIQSYKYITTNKNYCKRNIIIDLGVPARFASPSGFPLIVLGMLASSPASGLSATIPNAN